jgi:hypothetical protein
MVIDEVRYGYGVRRTQAVGGVASYSVPPESVRDAIENGRGAVEKLRRSRGLSKSKPTDGSASPSPSQGSRETTAH